MNNPLNKEFNRHVSVDTAPYGSSCKGEDCGKPALHHYLVTAGVLHGQSEFFCGSCGEKFIDHVERISKEAKFDHMPEGQNDLKYSIHNQTRREYDTWKVIQTPAGHDEKVYDWEEDETWSGGTFAQ